jgi:hypothetical protein
MALSLAAFTPKRREHQLSFETASLNGSSSPTEPDISSPPRRDRFSPKKFTFTPQRIKTLPRAWERRPATPYLARNEAQKIWKRVPLGSITSNYRDSWNKTNCGPIMRPVKKLRVTQIDREEDKENIDYIASKWDEDRKDSSSPKRKVTGFTAINREEKAACYSSPGAVTMGDVSAAALGDAVTTDSDFTEDEDLEDSHGQIDPSSSEHSACSNSSEMDPLMDEEELSSQSRLSDDQGMSESSAPEDSTAVDAPCFGLNRSGTGEGYEPPTISTVPEASMVPAQAGTNNAVSAGEDDTAFLHDFLSRARAQKAARQQPEQQSDVDGNSQPLSEAMDIEEEIPKHASPVKSTEDIDGRSFASESDTAILQPDAQPDAQPETNQLSPCRRSSRLITRLPRPQKQSTTLPSSIALKRLTGTEFISQKETQSVALMTRSNTKRNKGVAKSVQERLMQLDAEAKARDPTTVSMENGRKKRKKAKEVTWAVQLTRFQTDTPVLRSTEEPEQPELSVAPDVIKEETLPAGKLESVEVVTDEEEKKQVRKVRKLRKLNVGTYNGTPAPKKTISLPVPVASAFSIENCKSMPSLTTSEPVPDNVIQPEVKVDPTTALAKPKPSTVGSEKRFQTRMRTRNRT